MDYEWIEKQLEQFVEAIDRYRRQNSKPPPSNIPTQEQLIEQSAAMEQVVRAIRPDTPWVLGRRDHTYTFDQVREAALEALGVVRVREDLARHLDPAGPQLAAAHLHPWVWDAAASLWETRHFRAAVQASATSVDVHLQAKLDRRDTTGTALAREAFTLEAATPSRPRLRLPGDRSTPSWRARQAGARDFAAGCFEAVRNPASHEIDEPAEQEAIEQLAALSLLAGWIDSAEVDVIAEPE